MPYSFLRPSLQRLARMVDLALVAWALLMALIISAGSITWPNIANLLILRIKVVNLLLAVGYLAFCSLIFSVHGFYASQRVRQWKRRIARIILAVMFIASGLLVLREPLDLAFATNSFVIIFWVVCSCMLILVHEISRLLQYIARVHGRNLRNVVIIGDAQRGRNLAARIEQQSNLGYRVLRIISPKEPEV